MFESCLGNFLKSYDYNQGETHSDSSDFENENEIPIINPKHGKHRLLLDKSSFIKPERDINSYQASNKNTYNNTKIKCRIKKLPLRKCRTHLSNMNSDESIGKYQTDELSVSAKNNNKNSDQSLLHLMEKSYSKITIRNKVIPRLSTLFRRPNNCKNHMECIEEDRAYNKNNYVKYCPYNSCQKPRKNRRGYREQHIVQPVYTVNENGNGFLFPNRIQQVSLSKDKSVVRNEDYELSFDISSVRSVSDNETVTKKRHSNFVKEVKQRLEKEIRNYYTKKACARNENQQFPSKSQLKSPNQVFTSASCQAERTSIVSNRTHLPSTSSHFWDFLAGKLKFQVEKAEVMKRCHCTPFAPCNPSPCENKNSKDTINGSNPNLLPKEQCCCKLPSNSSNSSLNRTKTQEPNVLCQCDKDIKKKDSKMDNVDSTTEETKPCQQEHEKVVSFLAQKHKGEIICIHNPPCVLINGCLNLPPLKSDATGSYFPVTQIKKSSFSQMCRKIKKNKKIKSEKEQASQYHPGYGESRELLSEFGAEKIIQSVCNHVPPCEIVPGCYRAKYNPKLLNSCIHVPSCDKLPECLLEKKDKLQNNICLHEPTCAELPLCSRKYIVLTAKADVCTQVKPKAKMMCRHEPPCFMIPKCLAWAICSNCIPAYAIPGCAHQPSCEMIPACCRKSTKETVSVPSQYPNKSCRIV